MFRRSAFFLLGLVAGSFALDLSASDNEMELQKLRGRVTQFLMAVQMKQTDKAVEFLVEKARKNYSAQHQAKLLGFKILNIRKEEGGQSAIVEVTFTVLVPTIVRPADVPDLSRWKLVSGEWYMDPEDPPPSLGSKFQEYYFDKVKKDGASKGAGFHVHFDRDEIDIGLVPRGKTLSLVFPFTNQSSEEIKIEEFYFRAPFLKSTTQKMVFKPGEKGEVDVELDTTPLLRGFDHTFYVEFQPIKELIPLRIKGKVSVKTKF
jgi:hypothetical protein